MKTDQPPPNFRWLQEGRIAGSGLPEEPEQIDALYAAGVRALVSFHPLPEPARERLRERGMEHLAFPVTGFTTALGMPLSTFFKFVDSRAYPAEGPARPVLFH